MKCEFLWFIKWFFKEQIKKILFKCFEKYYFKVCCIIDCLEVFIEIFFSLELQVICWLDYKYYCIFKFFIVIILNGLILFVFDWYGGRVLDKYIVFVDL